MIKTLTRQGNSAALIIDRAIMELMGIDMQTPLKLTLNGRQLVIEPADGVDREVKAHQPMHNTAESCAQGSRKGAD